VQNARGAENRLPTPAGGNAEGVVARDAEHEGLQGQNRNNNDVNDASNQNMGMHRNMADDPFLRPIATGQTQHPPAQRNDPAPGRWQDPHPHDRVYPGPLEPLRRPAPGKKNTKAAVKVAALNINGRGNPDVRHGENKWYHVWQLIREQKIGVMIVGEAHLDDVHKMDVDSLFGRVIKVEFTPDETAPTARAGLAFVLNKGMVETAGTKTIEIVPGRAMILEMKNMDGTPLSILGVYTPNRPTENAAFWKKIEDFYVTHPRTRRPDVFGGDTNIVEDAMDRLPSHQDNKNATDALDKLKSYLRMVDGFRETYPSTRAYTYMQSPAQGGAQSRIDRIYVKRDLYEESFEWDIQAVGINTDHRMVSMKITTADAPTLGHGRWVWPV
jgi:exonuclease III